MLVSVSLRSIIHSYSTKHTSLKELSLSMSFRLLTEYHSFLFLELYNNLFRVKTEFPSPYGVSFILILNLEIDIITEKSFRLLTEYHSFL